MKQPRLVLAYSWVTRAGAGAGTRTRAGAGAGSEAGAGAGARPGVALTGRMRSLQRGREAGRWTVRGDQATVLGLT